MSPPGILDVDVVDSSMGWILGAQCGFSVASPARSSLPVGCQYGVQPVDAARPWPPAFTAKVGQPFLASDGDAPRSIHFLNRTDGFVYGHGVAFVTRDAGHTWKYSSLPTFEVVSITGRGKSVWAVTRDCAKGTACPFGVRSSMDAGQTWSSPRALPDGFSPVGAATYGPSSLVAWSQRDLVLTSDGGTTWTLINGKCSGDLALRQFAVTADGRQMWQLCTPFPPDYRFGLPSRVRLFLSEDAGISWSERGRQRFDGVILIIASPVVGTLAIASDRQSMVVTHDGGLTWINSEITFPPASGSHLNDMRAMIFATAKDGLAFDVYNKVWATHDGGDTWADTQIFLSIPYADQP
jgi:hypothetical protein